MVKFLSEALISVNSGYFCNVKKESINGNFFGFGIKKWFNFSGNEEVCYGDKNGLLGCLGFKDIYTYFTAFRIVCFKLPTIILLTLHQ